MFKISTALFSFLIATSSFSQGWSSNQNGFGQHGSSEKRAEFTKSLQSNAEQLSDYMDELDRDLFSDHLLQAELRNESTQRISIIRSELSKIEYTNDASSVLDSMAKVKVEYQVLTKLFSSSSQGSRYIHDLTVNRKILESWAFGLSSSYGTLSEMDYERSIRDLESKEKNAQVKKLEKMLMELSKSEGLNLEFATQVEKAKLDLKNSRNKKSLQAFKDFVTQSWIPSVYSSEELKISFAIFTI